MSANFDQRYLLARYPTGGVVVDLESGNYYRVNASAALVCNAMSAGGDVDERVAVELHIPRKDAEVIVADVAARLAAPALRGTPQGAYHFHSVDAGYVLLHGERTVLEVTGTDLDVRLPSESSLPSEAQLELYVRALAPKLLFQRRVTVLHASACVAAGRLIAFAGVSGAGKTTAACAFAAAGARLVSEDLVVVAQSEDRAEIIVEGEAFIHAWARRVATQLVSEPRNPVSAISLASVADGATARLDQILFLDSSGRSGTDFTTSALVEPDALISLMTNDFLGAVDPGTWRRFFQGAVALLDVVDLKKASAPDGLDLLTSAAARYISRIAS